MTMVMSSAQSRIVQNSILYTIFLSVLHLFTSMHVLHNMSNHSNARLGIISFVSCCSQFQWIDNNWCPHRIAFIISTRSNKYSPKIKDASMTCLPIWLSCRHSITFPTRLNASRAKNKGTVFSRRRTSGLYLGTVHRMISRSIHLHRSS